MQKYMYSNTSSNFLKEGKPHVEISAEKSGRNKEKLKYLRRFSTLITDKAHSAVLDSKRGFKSLRV